MQNVCMHRKVDETNPLLNEFSKLASGKYKRHDPLGKGIQWEVCGICKIHVIRRNGMYTNQGL